MDIEPIEDHAKMMTLMICKSIYRYLLENPSVPYSQVVLVLANVQYAVGLSLDNWYEQLENLAGTVLTEQCVVPELHELIEFPDGTSMDDSDWDYGLDLEEEYEEEDEDEF